MKRVISLIIALLMLAICCSGCQRKVKAEDDSFNIAPDYMDLAKNSPSDEVIKVLYGNRLYKFALGSEIDEVWANSDINAYAIDSYVTVSDEGELSSKEFLKISDDKIEAYDGFEHACDDLFTYALHPEKVFAKETEIINTYCFVECVAGDYDSYAYYIYFATSRGDYVLYKIGHDGETYLFPKKKFIKMIDALAEEYKLHEGMEKEGEKILHGATSFFGTLMPSAQLFDPSPYKFTERS